MSHDRLDDEDMPGYFLPEDSQFRLVKLRDHVRFLARLAQPRTQAEERAAEPKVRMGELALCLELLADQVDVVLDVLSYPAQRIDTMYSAGRPATTEAALDADDSGFRITQEQIDRLTLLAETVSAHAQTVAVGDATERAGQTLPKMDDTLCDTANAIRALLLKIACQPLRAPTPSSVREARAVYTLEPVAPPAGSERLH
ncbi:XAC0095 family protein [Xanthomonas sacchari]|uniref:XAC0095 family protein n=1 Tax=Xanthomonas sacchari TaxID=56458 RepID=UPI0020C44617|nr:hypothetical protein [Xanthomonas sacchari]